jgi:arginase family enzyme
LHHRFWKKFLEERAGILRKKNHQIVPPSLIAIVGVPMDIGVGYRHGARFGPRAIRDVSAQFGPGVEGGFDLSRVDKKIIDLGDIDIHPYLLSGKIFNRRTLDEVRADYRARGDVPPLGWGNLERIQSALEWIMGAPLEPDEEGRTLLPDLVPDWKGNVFPVILGGDHSITLPCIRALKKIYAKENLGIIYFDAHPDYLPSRSGLKETHASQARRVAEEVGPENVFEIGLRYIEPEEAGGLRRDRVRFWTMEEMTNLSADAFSEILFREIKEQKIGKLYLSIDIDVLDASIAPGTGVPEPGGMNTRYLIDLIQNLGKKIEKEHSMEVAALDLVEVAPDWDMGNITALAAAKIIFETLGAYFMSEKDHIINVPPRKRS